MPKELTKNSTGLFKTFAEFAEFVENGIDYEPGIVTFPTGITDLIIKKSTGPEIIKNLFSTNCNMSRIAK